MLDRSRLVIYRFHDHAHLLEPDLIHKGFINSLNLKIERKYERDSLGVCRYNLVERISVQQFVQLIADRLNVEFVRVIGNVHMEVKTICLGLGGVGMKQLEIFMNTLCDVFVVGELGEVLDCEYVRDACYFGEKSSDSYRALQF